MLALPFGRQHAPTVGETAPTSRDRGLSPALVGPPARRHARSTREMLCSKDIVGQARTLTAQPCARLARRCGVRKYFTRRCHSRRTRTRSVKLLPAAKAVDLGVERMLQLQRAVAERPPALESHDEVDLDDSTDDPRRSSHRRRPHDRSNVRRYAGFGNKVKGAIAVGVGCGPQPHISA